MVVEAAACTRPPLAVFLFAMTEEVDAALVRAPAARFEVLLEDLRVTHGYRQSVLAVRNHTMMAAVLLSAGLWGWMLSPTESGGWAPVARWIPLEATLVLGLRCLFCFGRYQALTRQLVAVEKRLGLQGYAHRLLENDGIAGLWRVWPVEWMTFVMLIFGNWFLAARLPG